MINIKSNPSILQIVLVCVICVAILSLLGFSFIHGSPSKDKNEEAIKAFVNQMFTCPDNELIEASRQIVVDTPNEHASSGIKVYSGYSSKFEEKLKEKYAPYFSNSHFESFCQQAFPLSSHFAANKLGITIEVDKIDIVKEKDITPVTYTFTAHLKYGPENGEKKQDVVTGSAQFGKDKGKITWLKFDKSDFTNKIVFSIGL